MTDENDNSNEGRGKMEMTSIDKLTKDLKDATISLNEQEARFLVDAYYIIQEDRKRSGNQVRAMKEEPHAILAWFFAQNKALEGQIKTALTRFSESRDIGRWAQANYGIGPVITAGLMAHIDITKCPTVGHIWRYAGLDPTSKWEKGQKRPWNASLKTLCWHIGQSFMKFSGRDECFYGKKYLERKAYEVARNESGENAALAAELLPKFNKATDAYKHLSGGKLPPAQIDARARRWAVKLFLAHLHGKWWEMETGTPAPLPYPIAHLGHVHMIPSPIA